MSSLSIYTDGACRGNGKADSLGGWGFLVLDDDSQEVTVQQWGGETGTTNNRMELMAMIKAVEYVRDTYKYDNTPKVKFYTDSNYVQKGLTTWMAGWIKKDWKEVKNTDLWKYLLILTKDYDFEFIWVKAHADNIMNNRADLLANRGCDGESMVKTAKETEIFIESPSNRDRFVNAVTNVYAISKVVANELFDKYSAQTEHDYHSVTQRIFVEIRENSL